MGTDSCQFANNATLINDVLQDQNTAFAGFGGPALGFFCTQFRRLVRDMLKEEPAFCPSASRALESINKIDSDLARFLDNPTLELCITLRGKKTQLVEIGLSELRTDGHLFDELNRRYRDVAISHRGRIASWFYRVSAVQCVRFTLHNPDCPTVQIDELLAPSSASFKHRVAFVYLAGFMNGRYNQKDSQKDSRDLDLNHKSIVRDHRDLYRETIVRDQVPKKFGQSSLNQLMNARRPIVGWGLEIEDGTDWLRNREISKSVIIVIGVISMLVNILGVAVAIAPALMAK